MKHEPVAGPGSTHRRFPVVRSCRAALTRTLALLVGVSLAASLATSPAQASVRQPVIAAPGASYFGMHYSGIGTGSYPVSSAIGAQRMWDTGTSWRDIQPTRHTWNWAVLDAAVAKSLAHGASVLYVLGSTPDWAVGAKRSIYAAQYGGGSNVAPVHDADWVAYVRAVATRYKGRISSYELWNEVNILGYYAGSVGRLARLGELAYRTIKSVDRSAIVTGPSTTIRGTSGTTWQVAYARLGGFRYADVVNIHLYPQVEGTPEQGIAMFHRFMKHFAKTGVHKPVWNTEMNYGMPHFGVFRKHPLTQSQQAAWIIRSYLLSWSSGIKRQYWYDWSRNNFLGIKMVGADGHSVSAGGRGFSLVRAWMSGKMRPCSTAKNGTYTCAIQGSGVVTWNPTKTVTVNAPNGTRAIQTHLGQRRPATRGQRVRVGAYPILFAVR